MANSSNFQTFLDENQYSRKGILKYEKVFGETFVSAGGKITTEEFCKYLHLKSGENVLDVGCGIGGSGFHMAKNYGVRVHGVDLSSNMISIAVERQKTAEIGSGKVSFEIMDVTTGQCPSDSYDVIYSRDTILHIEDKRALFAKFLKWLKPGGRLLISDYCRGNKVHSDDFRTYVAQRGYHLLTVADYGKILEDVGFQQVNAQDRTSQFIDILRLELERIRQDESFLKDFDQADFDDLVDGWKAKIERCLAGDQAFGLFMACKPALTTTSM